MPSRSYVAQRLGAFAELVQASTLAGFRLDALPPASVHDTYYDTPDGGLLTEGLQLRVREQDGGAVAALQGLDGAPVEVDVALATAPRRGAPLVPPHGPLLDALQTALALAPGDRERLDPLVSLRQYRTPRVAYDGARLVGLLSFDVVVVENVGDSQGTNELEVDHAIPAPDLARLDPVLRAAGLVAEPRSKYERALLRLRRDENEALLLLPRERELLQQIAEGGEPTARRRARVILLSSRGYGAGTVAAQTGLNAARVLHWKRLFLEHRLGMVGGAAPPPGSSRPYTISEIVRDAAPGPPASEPSSLDLGDGAAEAPIGQPPLSQTASTQAVESPEATPTAELEPHVSADDGLGAIDFLDAFLPGPTDTPRPDELDIDEFDLAPATQQRSVGLDSFAEAHETEETAVAARAAAPQGSTAEPAPGELPSAPPASPGLRVRPRPRGEDPVVRVAHDYLAYYRSQLAAAMRTGATPSEARLVLALHRVRLCLEAFQPLLPADATMRVHRALFAPIQALSGASTNGHQGRDALASPEVSAALERLDRLVARLGTQAEADRIDDAPLELAGELDEVRSRLGHFLGSRLWDRYERLLASADPQTADLEWEPGSALRQSASLRFLLGIAQADAPGAVRESNRLLVEAERALSEDSADGQARVHADALRRALADVLAGLGPHMSTAARGTNEEGIETA